MSQVPATAPGAIGYGDRSGMLMAPFGDPWTPAAQIEDVVDNDVKPCMAAMK